MRKNISSGSSLEQTLGYSRAVRIGSYLSVSGTAPVGPDGKVVAPGDVYGQTKRCLEIASAAILAAGMTLEDTIRTRVMLTDISRWEEAARAHGEVFKDIKPACTFVGIGGLINPAWLVEIEFDCVSEQGV
ncbi:MAG: RidA family protein [Rhodocyclaceae bacterium]|nr:MAG: RidA family protein [Rhodocyclaceae bacterium]